MHCTFSPFYDVLCMHTHQELLYLQRVQVQQIGSQIHPKLILGNFFLSLYCTSGVGRGRAA